MNELHYGQKLTITLGGRTYRIMVDYDGFVFGERDAAGYWNLHWLPSLEECCAALSLAAAARR